MKIVFATGNLHKLREAQEILGPDYELVIPSSLGISGDIPETGATLGENSLQKALYIFERTGLSCFADDSGLEVDALGGAPGVHSARYAAEIAARDGHPDPSKDHVFEANMDALLRELDAKGPDAPRTARFRTVVTLLLAGGGRHVFEGEMPGSIAREKSGTAGFGYDPVFVADACPDRTIAETSEEFKNSISHRGKALRAMAAWLAENPQK